MSSSSRSRRSVSARRPLAALIASATVALLSSAARSPAEEAPAPRKTETMTWRGSAEVGYRFLDFDGSEALFRSHSNLDDGARLFNLSLHGAPKGASSRFMDSLELTASGLGGDPQEWVRFTMRKRGSYRWDVRFDQSDYFFDVPDFVRFGQHTNKNDRRNFDTTLELSPGTTRVYLGYARREFDGPAFLTQDFARDEFRVFAPVDRDTQDIRAGIDFKAGRWSLGVEQSYRTLSSLSAFELDPNSTEGNAAGGSTLSSFSRRVPLDGRYWISRASAQASFADRVDLSLRLVHSAGATRGSSFQAAAGAWFTTGNPAFTETVSARFDSDLPSSLAEAGVTIRLTDRVYLNNTVRFHDYDIEGSADEDLDRNVMDPNTPVIVTSSETFSRLTEWTSWEARTEAEWRLDRHWTLRGGYRRLSRDVAFEARTDGTLDERIDADQAADTFFGGAAFRWERKWSAHVEYSDGELDNVFLRVNPADFQLARVRGSYRPSERWSINVSGSYRHGENPTPDFSNEVTSRSYALSTDYSGNRLTLSAGYTAVNLDSTTDIAFCTASSCSAPLGTLVTDVSLWEFADSHYFANAAWSFGDRFKGFLRGQATNSRDTFPVDYYFVEPRLAVRLHRGYWLNLAWYRYEFDRRQDRLQDYRAQGALISFTGEF